MWFYEVILSDKAPQAYQKKINKIKKVSKVNEKKWYNAKANYMRLVKIPKCFCDLFCSRMYPGIQS